MTPFRFFHLKSIGGQIAVLVVASIVALHLILTASFLISRPDRAEPPDSAHQLADAALLLNGADTGERPRILADIVRAFPKAKIEVLAPETAALAADSEVPTCAICAGISALGTRWSRWRCRTACSGSRSNYPTAP